MIIFLFTSPSYDIHNYMAHTLSTVDCSACMDTEPTFPYDRNLTIMNEFLCFQHLRGMWGAEWKFISSDVPIATPMAKRTRAGRLEKKLCSIWCGCARLWLHAMYAASDWVFFYLFRKMRWYVSGWTRSVTLLGGQVSKKHESKSLWQARMERGVWCG